MCSICWVSAICAAPPPWRVPWRTAASTCCWCRVARPRPGGAVAARRAQEPLALLRAETPDILITEQFPFGRTRLRFELLPLLEAAKAMRPRPLIVSSVRDVVRRSASPQRVAESVEIFEGFFNSLLIHADPRLVEFARSFAGWD